MKKLLVATSALVVAAPAFANDVTLSGTLEFKASTEDGAELSTASVDTFEITLAGAGDVVGGNVTLGLTAASDIGVTGYDVYADSSIGKFNIGTSTGTMTDNDLTELEYIGDTGAVNFASGITGVAVNGLATYLTYSNSLGPVDVALTWGGNGMVTSVGGSFGGFDVDVDSSDAGSAVNVSGEVAGFGIKVESDDSSNYDLAVTGSFGDYGVAIGSNSNEDFELGVTANFGDLGVGLYSAEVAAVESTKLKVTTELAGYDASITLGESGGVSNASIELTLADGVTLSYGGNSGSEDLTIDIEFGF